MSADSSDNRIEWNIFIKHAGYYHLNFGFAVEQEQVAEFDVYHNDFLLKGNLYGLIFGDCFEDEENCERADDF